MFKIDSKWTRIKLQEPAVNQLLKIIPNLLGQDQDTNTIRLRTDKSCLWVEGKGKEDQEFTSIAIQEVTITGPSKEISLNRDCFLPALRFGFSYRTPTGMAIGGNTTIRRALLLSNIYTFSITVNLNSPVLFKSKYTDGSRRQRL